jgi:uncharacterized linocin/CFP29 family protein
MIVNHLLRELAPIPEEGWSAIDNEARSRLHTNLAARKLVDLEGPHGWERSSIDLGRIESIDGPGDGLEAARRRVQPLIELRVPFTVARAELLAAARGAHDLELEDLADACRRLAHHENALVFHGYDAANITGIAPAASHPSVELGTGPDRYPNALAKAVNALRADGIDGPFGLAVGPPGHVEIMESAERGGELLIDHLQRILGGGRVVRAPGVDGAVVVSQRGGDFTLTVGQDISIGYQSHDAGAVSLYLEESLTFRVQEPDAAVVSA